MLTVLLIYCKKSKLNLRVEWFAIDVRLSEIRRYKFFIYELYLLKDCLTSNLEEIS
jgi:hypothetical protein